MRRIVLYTICSLDGAVDDPIRSFPIEAGDEPVPAYDDVMLDQERKLIEAQDAVLLGRRTYDEWSQYWPTSTEQPWADFINNAPKYVVTSSEPSRRWGEVEVMSGSLASIVADLRNRPGGDIGVHGSITLAQSLLAEGLVDEVQLAVAPVLDPVGRRLSDGLGDLLRLTLVDCLATPSGALWLTYRPGRS